MSKFGRSNSKNVLGMLNTLEQSYIGDYIQDLENAAEAFRANAATNVSPELAAGLIRPLLKTMCKSIINRGEPDSDASMLFEMYKYFVDNAQRVQGRSITYGTPTAGTNTGNGQILRLTKDAFNYNIEAVHIEAKRLLCVADFQTGTNRGAEVFIGSGQTPAKDDLERSGSGAQATLTGSTADDSLLSNASWGNFGGTASEPTDITDWTSVTPTTVDSTTYEFDATNYFRVARGSTVGQGVNVAYTAGTSKITQTINQLPAAGPIYCSLRYMRLASATGNLVLRVGGASATATIGSATNGVWNILEFWAYPDSYTGGGVDVEIQVDTLATGTVTFDELVIASPTWIGGKAYVLLAGATDFAIGDYFTQQTTVANTGTVLTWLYRTYYPSWNDPFGSRHYPLNLPHDATASSGWEDPA